MSSQIQAFYAPARNVTPKTGLLISNIENCKVFFGWRNHPNLLRWFEMLYQVRNKTSQPFRGSSIKLDRNDIAALEQDIWKGHVLPVICPDCTSGSSCQYRDDYEFIDLARDHLFEGNVIIIVAST